MAVVVWKGVGANHAALGGKSAYGFVSLVPRIVGLRPCVGVGENYRLLRVLNGVQHRAVADVGEIDQDAELVHLTDRGQAKDAQAFVRALPAAVPEEVSLVVGELNDAYAQGVKEAKTANVAFDRRGVLPAEDDAGATFGLGGVDVGH